MKGKSHRGKTNTEIEISPLGVVYGVIGCALFFLLRIRSVWIIMPKTTVQKVIFGLLMSFFMVLAMELYNTGLRNGGLTNVGILGALRELPLMFALCFLTSTVVGDPLAARLAARLAVPREWPLAAVLARSAMTVCVMCPAMSLWATVIFQRPGIELVPSWLQTVVCNFPMAFFWQIFFCGPLVRRLFRLLVPSAAPVPARAEEAAE